MFSILEQFYKGMSQVESLSSEGFKLDGGKDEPLIGVHEGDGSMNGKTNMINSQELKGQLTDEPKVQNDVNDEKSESPMILPNISLGLLRKSEDSQDIPGETNDMHNGHKTVEENNVEVTHSSTKEETQVEDLPDTEILNNSEEVHVDKPVDNGEPMEVAEESPDETSLPKDEPKEEEKKDEGVEESQSFRLNLTESQLTPDDPKDGQDEKDSLKEKDPVDTPQEEKPDVKEDESKTEEVKEEKESDDYLVEEPPTAGDAESPEGKEKGSKEEIDEQKGVQVEELTSDAEQSGIEESKTKPIIEEPMETQASEKDKDLKETHEEIDGCAKHTHSPDCCKFVQGYRSHLKVIKSQIDDVIKRLDDYIKTDNNESIQTCIKALKEVECLADNVLTSDIPKEISSLSASSKSTRTTQRKTAGRRSQKFSEESDEKEGSPVVVKTKQKKKQPVEEEEKVPFEEVKGLAVFAKWPNSGWYYPGRATGVNISNWKEALNVTVNFYDGLVREMKNINILPAQIIPSNSILCDLEDETERNVVAIDWEDENSVNFTISHKDEPNEIQQVAFTELAIKAVHMKNIMQQLESQTDAVPKKMHMVSLVSGGRTRGKRTRDTEEETASPSVSSRKRSRKSDENSEKSDDNPQPSTSKATPNKRRTAAASSSTSRRSTKQTPKRTK